jgi:hypothetical protein
MKKSMFFLMAFAFLASAVYAQLPRRLVSQMSAKQDILIRDRIVPNGDNNVIIRSDGNTLEKQSINSVINQIPGDYVKTMPEVNSNAVLPSNAKLLGRQDRNTPAKQNFLEYAK